MADKKRGKKRKDEYTPPGEEVPNKPSKEEYNVGKWLRKNVPIKRTKFMNHNVEYFTGKRAVDALLESKFTAGDSPLFVTRDEIVDYLHVMLEHKFYHRARKVPVSEKELRERKKEKKKEPDSGEDEKPQEKEKEQNKGTDAESSVVEGKDPADKQQQKDKKKKKIRLEMHNDQRFVDSLDAYVWIYDPIPFHYWIFGALLVVGAIGICMFPLWPPIVRLGVYYISVAAACFLVSIIVMAMIRLILFCIIWLLTFGEHHLWILPNLTEDVGFLASFWPLYKYEYRGSGASSADKKKKNKKKKDKDSDAEDEKDGNEDVVENLGENIDTKRESSDDERNGKNSEFFVTS
ncbi:translocation protein SEC62 isoform X2 [Dendroctonus ponderosae]|uniref:Translocation protein SEC62 n=1 Tax=Dendroctonus ponderosae TaxID=77166 RepID=A0AAR5PJE8_DENPD|nr:translocation protein SEC62 isoform X2 [Dendroctonus ponderosae]